MNHLYHTLSPLFILVTIILSLVSILSPTPLFPERVSLLEVSYSSQKAPPSVHASTPLLSKRFVPYLQGVEEQEDDEGLSRGMRKGRRMNRVIKREVLPKLPSPSTSSSGFTGGAELQLHFGPLGACNRATTPILSRASCQTPTLTPAFTDVYSSLPFPSTADMTLLPTHFPVAPTTLSVSSIIVALAWLINLLSAIGARAPKWSPQVITKQRNLWRRTSMTCLAVGLVAGALTTLFWHIELAKVVSRINNIDAQSGKGEASMTASLGSAWLQLWVGWAFSLVSLILLAIEGFTR